MIDMMLVPALGCDAALYAEILPELSQLARCRVHIPSADRYDTMVDDLLADAPQHFAVLGTSMGARLALETTLAAPDRILGTVIIGSAAGPAADVAGGLRRSARIRDGAFETVIDEMASIISHLPGPRGLATQELFKTMSVEVGPDITARQSDALVYRTDRWSRLSEIVSPVLCLWGQYDQFSPCADGLRLAQTVQNGTYVELPDCGHFPTLEYPQDCADAIAKWLTSVT
jgi:pimeloyl-ACP methyl ester carboxylesterase